MKTSSTSVSQLYQELPDVLQVLRLEDESVASVSAGGFASAAVTGAGRLYMWGTLLQKEVRRERGLPTAAKGLASPCGFSSEVVGRAAPRGAGS